MSKALENARGFNFEAYEADSGIRDYLRNTSIKLTEKQKQEVEAVFGSVAAFRKAGRGKFKLSEDGVALDTVWQILSERSSLLDPETAEGDMPIELMAAAHAIAKENYFFNAFGRNLEEASLDSFLSVVSDLVDVPSLRRNIREMRSYADKQYKAAERAATKQRIAERKKISEEYNALIRGVKADERGKAKENLQKQKEAFEKQKEALKERYRALSDKRKQDLAVQRELFRERTLKKDAARKDRERKAKYRKRIEQNLKEITTWLMSPTDKKHVPEALRTITANFVESIDLYGDRKASERWQSRMLKLHDYMAKADSAGVDQESDAYFNVDEAFLADLKEFLALNEDAGAVWDMDGEQLERLDYFVGVLKNAIKDVNTILIDGKRQFIADYAEETIGRAEKKGIRYQNRLQTTKLGKILESGNVTPWYFFKNIGGNLRELYNDLRNGQKEVAFKARKAKQFYQDAVTKHKANKWLDVKDDTLKFRTSHGQDVEFTREQALTIYATARREAANAESTGATHLSVGGFVYDEPTKIVEKVKGALKKTKYAENRQRHPLSDGDVQKIMNWLTPDQKAFADELVGYMSKDMSALGNATSLKLSGYKKFTEPYYFPYKVSRDYLKTDPGKASEDQNRWKNWGASKATVKGANAPIILQDFTKVFGNHVNEMLTYASMAIPQENLLRVYNYKGSMKDERFGNSVKAAISTAYGVAAKEYLDRLIADLGGVVVSDNRGNMFSNLATKQKKAAVMASLSVAIQQPSSVVRAAVVIDLKYFATKPKKGAFKEAMRYAGTAAIKQIGGFDTGTSHGMSAWITADEPKAFKDKVRSFLSTKDASYRDDVLGLLPSKMDEITWGYIWEVVKKETAERTGLKGEALLEAAGKRFDDVIDATQVYDSTLSRSDIMRSKNTLDKMATSFMAEPTVTYNILLDAITHAKDKDFEGRVAPARALGVFVGASVFTAALKSLVYAMRDDDEDQSYWEKYVESVVDSLIGSPIGKYGYVTGDLSPLNMIPYVRDVISIFQGYDVERADLALIMDFKEAYDVFMDDKKDWETRVTTLAGAIGNLFGVPAKNAYRDLKGAINTLRMHVFGGEDMEETDLEGIIKAIESGLGIQHSVKLYAEALVDGAGNAKKTQRALAGIESEYQAKVEKYIRQGKKKKDAEADARSSIMSACTKILKPLYLDATTANEKAAILKIARSIKVGGKQLYNSDYDFAKRWKEE